MKEDHPLGPLPHRIHQSLFSLKQNMYIQFSKTKPTYVIILALTFAFGYLSASHYRQPPPEPQQPPSTPLVKSFPIDNFRVTTRCHDTVPPELIRGTVIDRIFNGISPYTNFPPNHAEEYLRKTRIKGWGSNGAVFENLIRRVRPRTIIEVGSFLGASAIHMANLTRHHGLETQILCLVDFRGWAGFRDMFKEMPLVNGDVLLLYQFMQNVVNFNFAGSILPVPFTTSSGLAKLCAMGVKADLIVVDAGHDFISAWVDINHAARILRPGGVLFGHDYYNGVDNSGVRRAVHLFAEINRLKIKTDGEHWVIDSVNVN